MNEVNYKDKLFVDYQGKYLDFDVAFGYLDRSYSEFNFASGENEYVEGYSISLNPEMLDGELMRDLAFVYNTADEFFQITLKLDGIIHNGKAKIAKKFGLGGVCLDLELHTA